MDISRYVFPSPCIMVNFLKKVMHFPPVQSGFEIVEVDGKRLRGKSQSEATHLVAEAFNNTNQTMTFIVIPTK